MSKTSDQAVRRIIEEQGEVPEAKMKELVAEECGVKKSTANTYILQAPAAEKTKKDGDRMVVSAQELAQEDQEIDVDGDEVLDMEVGEGTGQYFGNLEILKDVGHSQVPSEHEDGYFRRRMGGEASTDDLQKKTDVQVVTATMEDDDFSTLLIGKHGVGKDKLVLHICAKTNRPVIRLVANDDPDFVDLLIGSYTPDEDGGFKHQEGLLQKAIRNGYVFILDEFNTLSGKIQSSLNLILEEADKGELTIPETNEVVEPHPEFTFVATQNPAELGYGGREMVDQATGSRFIPVTIPPLDYDQEKAVVAQETEWDYDPSTGSGDTELERLLDEDGGVIPGIRALHDEGIISSWISTRDAIQVGRMASKLGSVQASAEMVLVGRVDNEDKDSVREKIVDTNW